METKIRVFLADSQVVFREGMHFILDCEEDIELVGEGTSADDALAFLGKEAVDVLVLSEDLRDTARRIEFAFPSVRLIFVGNFHPSDERARGGKAVFLPRDLHPRELVAAVRRSMESDTDSPKRGSDEGMDAMVQALRQRFFSLVDSL